MWQNWMVGALVLLAALYSLWYVLPGALRQRLARIHPALGVSKSCGSCSSCGGCAGGSKPKTASDTQALTQVVRFHPHR